MLQNILFILQHIAQYIGVFQLFSHDRFMKSFSYPFQAGAIRIPAR